MPVSTALIVGASRGLGLGLAREYASRGWDVIGTVRASNPPLACMVSPATPMAGWKSRCWT